MGPCLLTVCCSSVASSHPVQLQCLLLGPCTLPKMPDTQLPHTPLLLHSRLSLHPSTPAIHTHSLLFLRSATTSPQTSLHHPLSTTTIVHSGPDSLCHQCCTPSTSPPAGPNSLSAVPEFLHNAPPQLQRLLVLIKPLPRAPTT
jgi:hypothetical protein